MPASRVALYALSLISAIFAARGIVGKPLSYSTVLALAGAYVMLLAFGAVAPRLGLFADVMTRVAPGQCAILVRCAESEVDAWLRALDARKLVVTFSLLEASDATSARLRDSAHGCVKRVEQLADAARLSKGNEVKLVDLICRWHMPWLGRALREKNMLWIVPQAEIAASRSRLGAASRGIVAVRGAADAKMIEHWCNEIAEARVTAVALG